MDERTNKTQQKSTQKTFKQTSEISRSTEKRLIDLGIKTINEEKFNEIEKAIAESNYKNHGMLTSFYSSSNNPIVNGFFVPENNEVFLKSNNNISAEKLAIINDHEVLHYLISRNSMAFENFKNNIFQEIDSNDLYKVFEKYSDLYSSVIGKNEEHKVLEEISVNIIVGLEPVKFRNKETANKLINAFLREINFVKTKESVSEIKKEISNKVKTELEFNTLNQPLSVLQREFFKDSKLKTKSGKLMVFYHGSNNDKFTEFKKDKIGSTNDAGFFGAGFYFTPDKLEAKSYGKNVVSAYLNIKKPFMFSKLYNYNGEKTFSKKAQTFVVLKNLITTFPEFENEKLILRQPEIDYDDARKLIDSGESIKDNEKIFKPSNLTFKTFVNNFENMLNNLSIEEENNMFNYNLTNPNTKEIVTIKTSNDNSLNTKLNSVIEHLEQTEQLYLNGANWYIEKFSSQFSQLLKEKGYDGIYAKINRIDFDENTKTNKEYERVEVVAFEPNQIKNTNNHNPSKSNDIRFSLETNRIL